MPRLHSPYSSEPGVWTRGTLHAHGPHTGGKLPVQQILDELARQKYGFAMIVEHDALPPPSEVESLNTHGMILLRGCELTQGPHLLHVNAHRLIDDQHDPQRIIDEALSNQGLIVAAHPGFGAHFNHIPIEAMQKWRGLTGIEIYNPYIHRVPGSPWAIDKWDQLLSSGQRVWGFADDDAFSNDDIGRAFIVVQTPRKPDADAILHSLLSGDFFASSGLWFDRIECDGMTVRVRAPGAARIAAFGAHAARLAVTRGDSLELTVPATAGYVRFEAAGAPDEFAWTQPFFVSG